MTMPLPIKKGDLVKLSTYNWPENTALEYESPYDLGLVLGAQGSQFQILWSNGEIDTTWEEDIKVINESER